MGAWGTGPFDNDDAGDLIYEAEEDPAVITTRLVAVATAPPDAEIEADQASVAVGAAALVAAKAAGLTLDSESATEFVAQFPVPVDADTIQAALAAIKQVRTSSGLADLWDEEDQLDDWSAELDKIISALRSAGAPA